MSDAYNNPPTRAKNPSFGSTSIQILFIDDELFDHRKLKVNRFQGTNLLLSPHAALTEALAKRRGGFHQALEPSHSPHQIQFFQVLPTNPSLKEEHATSPRDAFLLIIRLSILPIHPRTCIKKISSSGRCIPTLGLLQYRDRKVGRDPPVCIGTCNKASLRQCSLSPGGVCVGSNITGAMP
jgi:hypothetical protein